jgi:hypothetical protein
MLTGKIKYFLLLALLIVYSGTKACHPLSGMHPSDNSFNVKKARYQSWIIGENEKGTNIVLELTRVKKGVTFDSIIFRGIKLKAFITTLKKGVEIKGIIPSGKSRIKIDYEVVNLPDQLIYQRNGEKRKFLLKNIRRETTRVY